MNVSYGTFNDVRNYKLRAWNRINTYLNIKDKFGSYVAKNYLKKFKRSEQINIFIIMKRINEEGFENVRRQFIRERFR